MDAPDRRWCADIAEHPTDEGKLYLASVLDAFDKSIVGWSMGVSATTVLVVNAVVMAITRRQPVIAPVHHSDRGTQGGFSDRPAEAEDLAADADLGSGQGDGAPRRQLRRHVR